MKRTLLIVLLTVVVCPGLIHAVPVSYMGKLAYGGAGANGNLSVNSVGPDAGWLSPTTSVSWRVDNTTTPGLWRYEYTIAVRDGGNLSTDIQCVILETSATFSWDDLKSVGSTPADWIAGVEVNSFKTWENRNLPSNVYGILFSTATVDPTTLTIRFDSDRTPVWGDIYARSFTYAGSYNTLTNAGWEPFLDDNDPTDPPANGSILNHILVPDTKSIPHMVPVPGAALLATLGVSLAGRLRLKRWL